MSKLTPARTTVVNPRRNSIADKTHLFKDIYFYFKTLMPQDAVGLVTLLFPLKVRTQNPYLQELRGARHRMIYFLLFKR
tara:strand:+ start:171 stop:407 length:237 start_codon:yes stop_codon:yes gene_type:complete